MNNKTYSVTIEESNDNYTINLKWFRRGRKPNLIKNILSLLEIDGESNRFKSKNDAENMAKSINAKIMEYIS